RWRTVRKETNQGARSREKVRPPAAQEPPLAEQSPAADALQPPLRCGSRAQLRRSVAMTSNVKGGPQIFSGLHAVFGLGPSAEAEPARGDGGAGGSPWVGSHLPCRRRVPAAGAARPTFKGVRSMAANFVLLPFLGTRPGQYPPPHR